MDEKVAEKFLEYLEEVEAGVETVADFAAEQAPLVVREFLMWEIAIGLAIAAGSAFMIAFLTALAVLAWKKIDNSVDRAGGVVLCTLCSIFMVVALAAGALRAGKAYIAPRVVVLEKLNSFRH